MRDLLLVGFAVILAWAVVCGIYLINHNSNVGFSASKRQPQDSSIVHAYFIAKMQQGALSYYEGNPKADLAGYTDGFSGFLYMAAFPGIKPADFNGVIGKGKQSGGEYSEKDGKLSFFGHAASDSGDIPTEGMAILLENIARRLSAKIETTRDVDVLVARISEIS